MAKLHEMSIKAALCMAVAALLSSPTVAEEGVEDYSPGPASEFNDTSQSFGPSGSLRDPFLNQCVKTLSLECSNEILSNLFVADEVFISEPCCMRVVSMGKSCHDGWVKLLVQIPQLRRLTSRALIKGEQIWSYCVSLAASSPSSI